MIWTGNPPLLISKGILFFPHHHYYMAETPQTLSFSFQNPTSTPPLPPFARKINKTTLIPYKDYHSLTLPINKIHPAPLPSPTTHHKQTPQHHPSYFLALRDIPPNHTLESMGDRYKFCFIIIHKYAGRWEGLVGICG